MAITVTFASDCPDPAADVDSAEKLVLFADVDGARAALARTEATLACSPPADPTLLARMWLVEGAMLLDGGDGRAATVSFAAARRVGPTVWIDGLGSKRREVYDAAVPLTGTGQIAIDLPVGVSGIVWVDGTARAEPVWVVPGEHLVQYGADGRAWFAKIALVSADQVLHVQVPAPPAPPGVVASPPEPVARVAELAAPLPAPAGISAPEPVLPPVPEPPPLHTQLFGHVAVGADLSFQTWSDASHLRLTDPGTVVLVPLEIGGGVSGTVAWARVAFSVAPVFGGRLPDVAGDGDGRSSRFAIGGHGAAGVSVGPLDLGVLGGGLWPGRIATALVVGFAIPGAPVEIELRPGLNVVGPERALAPAASLLLTFPGVPAGGLRR